MNLNFEEVGLKNNSNIYVWKDSEFWNILFGDFNGKTTIILAKPYELISTLIEKYRNKINNSDKNLNFLFNGNSLNRNLTVAGSGLCDNDKIVVINLMGMC